MAKHHQLGKAGEALAVEWLQQRGYRVWQQNWRWHRTEVDIVATKNEWLHIIEVKTSSTDQWGFPEQRVNAHKLKMLQRAASYWLQRTRRSWLQYDVIAITWKPNEAPLIEMIADVSP